MTTMTNEDVQAALTAGLAAGGDLPGYFAICVVDSGGHVVGLLRDTAAAVSAGDSAETKARTAVYLHTDTGGIPPTSPMIPALTAGVPYPLNMFAGGLVIRRNGTVIGAVGAAGSPDPSQDLLVARAAFAALGIC